MLFILLDGKPYMVAHGAIYPVTIADGTVTFYTEDAEPYGEPGRFTLAEVYAKCGTSVSSKKRTRKKRTEG